MEVYLHQPGQVYTYGGHSVGQAERHRLLFHEHTSLHRGLLEQVAWSKVMDSRLWCGSGVADLGADIRSNGGEPSGAANKYVCMSCSQVICLRLKGNLEL